MIVLPSAPGGQEQSWEAVFQLFEILPSGWALVGGQMVHLHCAERRVSPIRATRDADTALDIRSDNAMLLKFTSALINLGFCSAGATERPGGEDVEHRWVRDEAQIDVLVPGGIGRSQKVRGVTRSTTVAMPGAQQALDRSEVVEVTLGGGRGAQGSVRRPNMLGALVAKAAALRTSTGDSSRHLVDFATLASIAEPEDNLAAMAVTDRRYLAAAASAARRSRAVWQIPGWEAGLALVQMAIQRSAETSRPSGEVKSPWADGG